MRIDFSKGVEMSIVPCHVFCDGQRLDKVTAFDIEEGYAECIVKWDSNGEIVTKKVFGVITYEIIEELP